LHKTCEAHAPFAIEHAYGRNHCKTLPVHFSQTPSKECVMNVLLRPVASCALLIALSSAAPVVAQPTDVHRAVTLQATGTFARGGEFTGTITLNRFEQRGSGIVAIGFVQGVLRRGASSATAFAGEIAWPVTVTAGGTNVISSNRASRPGITPIGWPDGRQSMSGIVPTQAGCQVVDISLAPVDVNLLGFEVALSPVALSLAGGEGPVGALVCSVVKLVGNVAALVDVLNNVLGLLTGLLGGLTGGGLG
jgi:hypothetical protein